MAQRLSDGQPFLVPFVSLWPYLLMTFALAWGILGLFIVLPDQMAGLFGELTGNHPLFFLAVYSPAISAIIVIACSSGLGGLRRFFGRLLLWRCSAAWYVFLIVGIPLVMLGGSALKGTLLTESFAFTSPQSLLVALLLASIKGPVEEFGWRGLALPLLQRKLAPFWAGLVLGGIWGLWHLPAFLLSGTQQSQWSFGAFLAGCLALSVIVTALLNASRGSILLCALFHLAVMNPVLPDAQPYDTYLLLVVAAVIVHSNREAMFRRDGAVTEVVPREEGLDGAGSGATEARTDA